QRCGAGARRLQRGTRKGPALRPRPALCGNDFLREARQARLRKKQIASSRQNARSDRASRRGYASAHISISVRTIVAADSGEAAEDFATGSVVDWLGSGRVGREAGPILFPSAGPVGPPRKCLSRDPK